MNDPKQRHHFSSFDLRSVMLFAAFALGGTMAQAQTTGNSNHAGSNATGSSNNTGAAIGPSDSSNGTTAMDFERADTNNDGKISSAEAAKVPGLAARFKDLDKDRNGTLSRSEYDAYHSGR